MAVVILGGNPVHTIGVLPELGTLIPDFELAGMDLTEFASARFAGKKLVINIFPSVDTGTCAMSVRRFNQAASTLDNTVVLCVSADLPFAQKRFCGAEGIDNVTMGSSFRSHFGESYGVTLVDGKFCRLLARSVVVADATGTVVHTELVPDIGHEPNYESALDALN
jgi:thiol peroxidase